VQITVLFLRRRFVGRAGLRGRRYTAVSLRHAGPTEDGVEESSGEVSGGLEGICLQCVSHSSSVIPVQHGLCTLASIATLFSQMRAGERERRSFSVLPPIRPSLPITFSL